MLHPAQEQKVRVSRSQTNSTPFLKAWSVENRSLWITEQLEDIIISTVRRTY
jgi:hypothetical protein